MLLTIFAFDIDYKTAERLNVAALPQGRQGKDNLSDATGNNLFNLGYNNAQNKSEDTIIDTRGDGSDTTVSFQRSGSKHDFLMFQEIGAIDVVPKRG